MIFEERTPRVDAVQINECFIWDDGGYDGQLFAEIPPWLQVGLDSGIYTIVADVTEYQYVRVKFKNGIIREQFFFPGDYLYFDLNDVYGFGGMLKHKFEHTYKKVE